MTCGTSGRSLLSASLSFLALGSVLFFAGSGIGADDDDVPGAGGGGGAEAMGVAVKFAGGSAAGEDPLLSSGRKAVVCLMCCGVVASHAWR